MWATTKVILGTVSKLQKRFTTVQKCILIATLSVLGGVVSGFWLATVAFLGTLLLGFLVGHQLFSREIKLDIASHVLSSYEVIKEKFRDVTTFIQISNQKNESELYIINGALYECTLPELEVSQCLECIHRDFVKSWYEYISDEEEFLDEVKHILEELSMVLMERVKGIDILSVAPEYIVLVRKHIINYQEAVKHFHTQPNVRRKKDRTKEFKKVQTIVESFSRLGKYHIAIKNGRELELAYQRVIVEALLQTVLPKYLNQCSVPKELICEILTCQVLGKVVEMFCEPDFLHKVMVLVLSDEELEEPRKEMQGKDDGDSVKDLLPDNSSCPEVCTTPVSLQTDFGQTINDPIDETLTANSENIPGENVASEIQLVEGQDEGREHNNNSTQTESTSAASSEETQPKVMFETEQVEDLSQNMFVSDALSRHFRVSSENLHDVRIIDSQTSLSSEQELNMCETRNENNNGRSLSSSPVSHTSKINLSLNQHATAESSDNEELLSQNLTFTPSFFLANDDNISVHSNSSTASSERNPTPERPVKPDASRDSHNLSAVRQDGQSETKKNVEILSGSHSEQNESKSLVHKTDVTDSSHVHSGKITQICYPNRPASRIKGFVESTHSQNSQFNGSTLTRGESTDTNLRRVASFDALLVRSDRVSHPPVLTSAKSIPSHLHVFPSTSLNQHVPLSSQPANQPNNVPSRPRRLSVETLSESTSEGPIEASTLDMPNDLFMNVHIYATDKVRDPSGSMYVIYHIKYRAWHLECDTWYLRACTAHRRYREFVTLHERLDEHPIYKKKIKDIKGPQRWKILPFGQIEIHGIEARRKFLEHYLQMLITRDQVGNSLAVREFLAYEGDARIAFVKKASEVPRIDKVIAKTFSGMINKLTTRPPSHYPEDSWPRRAARTRGEILPSSQNSVEGTETVDQDSLNLDYAYSHNDQEVQSQTMENVLSHHAHKAEPASPTDCTNYLDNSPEAGSDDEGFKDAIETDFVPTQVPSSIEPKGPEDPTPLISAILDLAVELANGRNSWLARDKVIMSFKAVAGQTLEKMLQAEIDQLTTCDRCSHYVRLLRDTLWPGGQLDDADPPQRDDAQKTLTKLQARRCLVQFLPSVLPAVVGQDDFDYAVDQVMEIIQHPSLNRHLVYTLLDALIHTVFPEVSVPNLQQQLLMKPVIS